MLLFLLACETTTPPAAADDFWATWGDGKGELSSYDLVQPRYGNLWNGIDVMVFVTEDFSWSERVKADPGEHPDADIRKVLKLNETRDFQTGIYPYHVMTSTFARLDAGDGMRAMDPIKVAFGATEWCGMVYDELVVDPGKVRFTEHTYFDKDRRAPWTMDVPTDAVLGDDVALLVRGLRGEWLKPGERRTVPWVPSELATRFGHTEPKLGKATVSREAKTASRTVPAGTFEVDVYAVAVDGGDTTTWYVEHAGPHRIVGWESSAGEKAAMRGSARLPYWELNKPGGEAERAKMGL